MTTQTLRVTEPRDILAMVPFQLGFVPTNSLVTISLRGPRRRVGLVTRVDLPLGDSPGLTALADQLTGHLAGDGARDAVVVLYSDHADPVAALHHVIDAMEDALETARIPLLDAWHVGAERYRSLLCAEPCCPAEGFPVENLLSSVIAAEMTLRGVSFGSDREEALGDLTPAPRSRLAEVERAAVRQQPPPASRDRGRPRARWARRGMRAWRDEVARVTASGDAPGCETAAQETAVQSAGLLLAGLQDLTFRDAVLLACVPGSGSEPERFAAAARPSPLTEALFDRVFGVPDSVPPELDDVRVASEVLRSLVRQATGRRAAPPLSLLAWLAWWAGDGGIARGYVERAIAADPGHRFASLLAESLERCVAPGWVQQRRLADEWPEGRVDPASAE